ncbi:MAG: biopolymer transporter ExbD [Akkermansia sp.]
MKFRYSMPAPVGFQLAPMLDVVFLLLIFFVVTQTISLTEQDLKVKVPSAQQADKKDSRAINEIILNVRKDGKITINREVYTKESLYPKLVTICKLAANQPVRIRGDAEAPYQHIIDVLDTCLKAGIWNISFSTRKPGANAGYQKSTPQQS